MASPDGWRVAWASQLLRSLLSSLLLAGCSSMKAPLRTVPHVTCPIHGRLVRDCEHPVFRRKNCHDSIESYALRDDGNIDNWFTCRKKSFDAPLKRQATALAQVKDKTSNAEWRVRFFKVLSVQYLILDLDPRYQWVAIGHPSRRYGWIMSRSKTLPESTYQGS